MTLDKLFNSFVPQFPHLSNVETSLVGWQNQADGWIETDRSTWSILNTLLLKDLTWTMGSETHVPDFLASPEGLPAALLPGILAGTCPLTVLSGQFFPPSPLFLKPGD